MREVLGSHVAQKGSLNTDENLRFDFSHFAKVTDEELAQIEKIVNRKIRQNIPVIIKEMPKDEAMKLGAMALFGEKYGDTVRVVIMDENFSIELCGGTHVINTGELNLFKIISESAVAAGVRRFEALAGCKAEAYIMAQLKQLNDIKLEFKNPKDLLGAIKNVQEKNVLLQKELDRMESAAVTLKREELYKDCLQQTTSGTNFIGEKIVGLNKAESLKQLALDLVKVKEIQLVVL
jgi:alanyl-tRNA synthetase